MQETNFEYELIIADDCSPDKTETNVKDIITNHLKGYLIKYFRLEKNLGMHANGVFAGEIVMVNILPYVKEMTIGETILNY